MNKYYISNHCRYIKGAHGSAIYDLKNESVYSINKDGTTILDNALLLQSDECSSVVPDYDKGTAEFIEELCQNEFLNCDKYSIYHGHHCSCADSDKHGTTELNNSVSLRYVWLELTGRCNCKCIHCYGDFGHPSAEEIQNEFSFEEWKSVLTAIRNFGGNAIQFIGGEPLMYPQFDELLLYAHDIGIQNIDIFTNGTLLNEHLIEIIKKTGASVRVSLYGYDDISHEKITGTKNSFTRLDRALDLLKDAEIHTKIAVVIMEENQHYLDDIIRYIESKGHVYTGFDTVRKVRHSAQNSHAATDLDIIKHRYQTKPVFYTSLSEYNKNIHFNSCWYGKLAVTSTGNIIPCIFARDNICGNIKTDSIDIIRKKLLLYWGITKDKVAVCKDCEYRYACDDCRPLADGETGELYGKYPRCLYDPYTGVWGDIDIK